MILQIPDRRLVVRRPILGKFPRSVTRLTSSEYLNIDYLSLRV